MIWDSTFFIICLKVYFFALSFLLGVYFFAISFLPRVCFLGISSLPGVYFFTISFLPSLLFHSCLGYISLLFHSCLGSISLLFHSLWHCFFAILFPLSTISLQFHSPPMAYSLLFHSLLALLFHSPPTAITPALSPVSLDLVFNWHVTPGKILNCLRWLCIYYQWLRESIKILMNLNERWTQEEGEWGWLNAMGTDRWW